jgi:CheY-like chemotaxis protein
MGPIVVIDDDLAVCDVLRMALEDDGYRVTCCNDPSAAIGTILDMRADLVTLDWTMHEPGGPRVFDAIRANPRTAGIPIVICTADWTIRDLRAPLVGRDTQILLKPFELDDLMETVRRMTGRTS